MKNFSYIKKLSNDKHIEFVKELDMALPEAAENIGVVMRFRTAYKKEEDNLSHCRKNHARELFIEKVKLIKTYVSSYMLIISRLAGQGNSWADEVRHQYDICLKGKKSYLELFAACESFTALAEAHKTKEGGVLLGEIKRMITDAEALLQSVVATDKEISCIQPQDVYRTETDESLKQLVAWMQVVETGDVVLEEESQMNVEHARAVLVYVRKMTERAKAMFRN